MPIVSKRMYRLVWRKTNEQDIPEGVLRRTIIAAEGMIQALSCLQEMAPGADVTEVKALGTVSVRIANDDYDLPY